MSLCKPFAYDDFYALPSHNKLIYRPTGELWPRESVDSVLPPMLSGTPVNGKRSTVKPSEWLMQTKAVNQMAWMPGWGEIIEDKILTEGGWEALQEARVYNRYKAPKIILGDAAKAAPYVDHLNRIFPGEADDILDWFAHRVQKPWQKINHALVMGSKTGIGKDWLLRGLKYAVGANNSRTIRSDELVDKNNASYVEVVVLVVNEAHDLGETGKVNRYALYERVKLYAAAPPDVISCTDKWTKRHWVPNVLGLILCSNHKTDGLHLESDDRRHLVCWSEACKEDFPDPAFWTDRYDWLDGEGAGHVAAFLTERDLSAFNPSALPRQTAAFFEIVHAASSPQDAELQDALDELGRPDAVTLSMLLATTRAASMPWLEGSPRSVPHRLERCGYVAIRNPNNKEGLWSINKRRQMIYGKTTATPEERGRAAWNLAKPEERAS
jgi:hypothetical protein